MHGPHDPPAKHGECDDGREARTHTLGRVLNVSFLVTSLSTHANTHRHTPHMDIGFRARSWTVGRLAPTVPASAVLFVRVYETCAHHLISWTLNPSSCPPHPPKMLDMATVFAMVGNVGSVVGVVIMNKYIVSIDAFNFMVFLSFTHFVFTYFGCCVLLKFRFFTYKPAPLRGVLPVALGSLGSVAFMNLNLAHNSVGFYQLSKLACIPVTIFLERVFYGKTVPGPILLTLIPITIGVGIATVNDVTVNFVGTVFAAFAVLFTSLAQIFTSTYQKQLDCDALQLLYHSSPLIAGGMFCMIPFFDNVRYLVQTEFSIPLVNHMLSSCVLALGVNISNYLVLGKTSPLTYQVLGHLKTILILVLGFVVFHYESNMRAVIGIVVALGGVIAYTELKRRVASQGLVTVMNGSSSGGRGGIQYTKLETQNDMIPDGEVGEARMLEMLSGPMKV